MPTVVPPLPSAEKESINVSPPSNRETVGERLLRTVRSYPLPLVAVILLSVSLVLWLVGRGDVAHWTLLAVVLLGGVPLLWETGQQLFHKEFSVDVIAILAIAGSLLLEQYLAGALIVLMLSGGEALEAYALRRARSSLSALAERAPRTAHIWQGDELISIPAEQIDVGMEIVVKPGELIPVDGKVTSGSSSVSEADLTGEPVPVRKAAGMLVLSGSVNLDGLLEIRASKRSAESKYAQIVHLVEEAQTRKAPIHRLADRYSIGFTIAALALASLAWILSRDSIYALAVLVVATPCPLILATPIAIMSGIDLAARNGLIAKSGAAIEQLGEVDIAVFDKTGTLTLGMPKVTAVVLAEQDLQCEAGREIQEQEEVGSGPFKGRYLEKDEGYSVGAAACPCPGSPSTSPHGQGQAAAPTASQIPTPEKGQAAAPTASQIPTPENGISQSDSEKTLLRLAASIEQLSTHILARAVVEAAQDHALVLSSASDFEETFGKGVRGLVPVIAEDRLIKQQANGDACRNDVGSDVGTRRDTPNHRQGSSLRPLSAFPQSTLEVEVAVGNRTFMRSLGIAMPDVLLSEREQRVAAGQICSFVAVEKQVEGLLVLEDVPRAEISRLSSDLHATGIKETILLTGDSEVVAQQVGEIAKVDRVISRCLPEDKVRTVKNLLASGHRVLMVGDGINDAPALATATVGMALGTQGLTAAATAADTVLLSTDILRVARSVRLGRRVMRVAIEGIWIGMGMSVIAMLFAAFGFISPAAGALLQEGIDVIVILNALRVGRITF